VSEVAPVRRVAVLGQGYVGLPLAMRAVEVGYEVVGYDTNSTRIKSLAAGESHVEDVPDSVVASALATGRYRPTGEESACAGFDVAVITVPTPLREGVPDLSAIEAAGATTAEHLRAGVTVVLESTTYPGTTTELLVPILDAGSGLEAGRDFQVGFSPERIDPGNPIWTLVNTPKVVSGIDDASLAAVGAFYATLVDEVVPVSGPAEAELSKLLENTFRHVNVALVNEMAMFAADLGIDVWESIRAASTKPFGFMPFTPGPGVGGHCLPIDPSYLSWRVRRRLGQSFRFVELANDVNDHMPNYVVSRLVTGLNSRRKAVNGSRVLLLGLAYKRNSSDARESPSVAVADLLLGLGAEVRAADPHVVEGKGVDASVVRVSATVEEAAAADAVILLTDHDDFDLTALAAAAPYFLDTRNRAPGPGVERL